MANASQLSRSRAARIAAMFRSQGFRVFGTRRQGPGPFGGPSAWVIEMNFRPGGSSTDEAYDVEVRDNGFIHVKDYSLSPSDSRDAMVREMRAAAQGVK